MTTRIAINGFGRVGRLALRAMLERYPGRLELVAINDIADSETAAYLFHYDSNYGPFAGTVNATEASITIDGRPIQFFSDPQPSNDRWSDVGAELIIESSGRFNDGDLASAHLGGTVKKVIISAPAKNVDLTIVLGVNDDKYDPETHHILSNASCTTNALAPVAKVMNDHFGIRKGLLTTVHAYTSSQQLLDLAAKKHRRSRSGALNIVPASTGAATAVGLVIPELQGRFTGMAFRVPISTVSVIDFTAQLENCVPVERVNEAMSNAANTVMEGILAYDDAELVSSDLRGNPHSSVFSPRDTIVLDDMVKVVSWYDNEWGYACRIADLAYFMTARVPALTEVRSSFFEVGESTTLVRR
jgi:glyceraldehyde 3-phosphate dehydrogenase